MVVVVVGGVGDDPVVGDDVKSVGRRQLTFSPEVNKLAGRGRVDASVSLTAGAATPLFSSHSSSVSHRIYSLCLLSAARRELSSRTRRSPNETGKLARDLKFEEPLLLLRVETPALPSGELAAEAAGHAGRGRGDAPASSLRRQRGQTERWVGRRRGGEGGRRFQGRGERERDADAAAAAPAARCLHV